MIVMIIRINFFITSLFFCIKVIFHLILLFQEYLWAEKFIAETYKLPLPILIHPLNLPIFGFLLGIISLVLFIIDENKEKEKNIKPIYVIMPFVYAVVWGLILFFGSKA